MDPETLKALIDGTIRNTIREEATKAGLNADDPKIEAFAAAMHGLIARAADTKGTIDRMSEHVAAIRAAAVAPDEPSQKFQEKLKQDLESAGRDSNARQ
jgi:hypothetical protein